MLKDIIPRRRSKTENLPSRPQGGMMGFDSLRREMNRLFDEFTHDFWPERSSSFWGSQESTSFMPEIDVKETDDTMIVTAELPGMKEDDLDIELTGESLILKGQKRQEHEEKSSEFHRMERRYGSFMRTISLPDEVDRDKVEAEFKDGVLRINLPKTEQGKSHRRRITVKGH